MCNILTNNYNMQFCTLDIPPLSLFLHHAYRSNLHEFMKVKHGQPLELHSLQALQYILTAMKQKTDLNLIDCITMKNDESKNTRVTAPLFLKDPKLKNSFCKRHKVDKRRMCITWPTGNKTSLIQMSPISKCVRHNSQS